MLLEYEREQAMRAMIMPVLYQLPLVFIYVVFNKRLALDKNWGSYYRHWVGGIIIPSLIQYIYILFGAIVFEVLELEAEVEASPPFNGCLAANFTVAECRNWVGPNTSTASSVHLALGDAPDLFRNFDYAGSAFFSFTLITTIGIIGFDAGTWGARGLSLASGGLTASLVF